MHMADALISPAVAGGLWIATGAVIAGCARGLRSRVDEAKVPLMGILGAFVFAAQMINFTIPGTGSSGHLGGGLLLAILLGPSAAFIVVASVLSVQALFFADGGLLALGANIFNLGVFPCFVAYPLIYRPIAERDPSSRRIALGSVLGAVVALQLGAFSVVLETVASRISELPFTSFVLLMQPVHLAIGVVEGLVTAAVVSFAWKAQPDLLARSSSGAAVRPLRKVVIAFAVAGLVTAGALSWFASAHPDGLEWSIAGVTGSEEVEREVGEGHAIAGDIQERISFLPDYGFRSRAAADVATEAVSSWPAVDAGTSLAGVVGGLLTLLLVAAAGLFLRLRTAVGERA